MKVKIKFNDQLGIRQRHLTLSGDYLGCCKGKVLVVL